MTLIGARTAIVVSSEQKVTRRPICQRPSRPPPSQVPRAIHSVVPITSCHEGSPLPRQPGVLPFLPRLLIADFPSRNGCLFQNPHRPCQKNNTASSIYPTPACSRFAIHIHSTLLRALVFLSPFSSFAYSCLGFLSEPAIQFDIPQQRPLSHTPTKPAGNNNNKNNNSSGVNQI